MRGATARDRAIAAGVFLGGFALAFLQRPGWATSDTKINLHVAPARFLGEVTSMWSSTGALGQVQSGQHAGYLFPMGPFFAVGHAAGLAPWVVQRLWLGTLLALAAWGVIRLVDALLEPSRGVAHVVAGALTLANPFVVTYANRTTVTLLAYAALPWLLLAVHEGLREPQRWRRPAAVAVLVTASGPGVNAAVTAWMLLGPALLLVYEAGVIGVPWRAVRAFSLKALFLGLLVSLWWIFPAYVQSAHGANFLQFTEQPGTVWGTTSLTESLRLMGFWLSYTGIGFAGRAIPYFDDSRTLLFSAPVVVASLLVPALAFAGFAWTRRWRYGPFFLALSLVALMVIVAGFPEGTPLRHGLTFAYNHVAPLRFLRTSYKAAPLLAIGLAVLAGGAAREGWRRLGATRRPAVLRGLAAVGGLVLVFAAAWPLPSGRAQDRQVSWQAIPAAWRAAATDLDRDLEPNTRAVVLPGQLFAFYRWGGTVDPILPALARRPVAVRSSTPYADLHATDLLWTVDARVHQRRLFPGELRPLLGLMGVGAVITGTDDDLVRSGGAPPAATATELAGAGSLGMGARSYGPVHRFAPGPGDLAPVLDLPEVRRHDLSPSRGIVRVENRARPLIVDGSAEGLASLASFGGLASKRALLYAGDLGPADIRRAATPGADVVITDSNRRRAFVPSQLEQNAGAVLAADDNVSQNGVILDPFSSRGSTAQTVAVIRGARSVRSPFNPDRVQFPEHRPFAALDGDSRTAWLADPTLGADRRWIEVRFAHPLDLESIDLVPYSDRLGTVTEVEVAGRQFAVHPGLNRLRLGLRRTSALRVRIAGVRTPRGTLRGPGGIRELRIPGVRIREELRPPVTASSALTGTSLHGVGLTYIFTRTTGDDPFHRGTAHGQWSAFDPRDRGDAERAVSRVFDVPVSRRFTGSGWARPDPAAPDDAFDRLAGYKGAARAWSSGRHEGQPGLRASRALDGNVSTAWVGDFGEARPWLAWSATRTMEVRQLTIVPTPAPALTPARVRLHWPGGSTGVLRVGAAGRVELPHRVHAKVFRLEIVGVRSVGPAGAMLGGRGAVGIAEIRGVRGLPTITSRRRGPIANGCGTIAARLDERPLTFQVTGDVKALDSGGPLLAHACGAPRLLPAGVRHLSVQPGIFTLDAVRLRSPASAPAIPAGSSPRLLSAGHAGRGRYDDVRVSLTEPGWLVLGESFDQGWRAWCDGRSLGGPVVLDGFANGWRVGPSCHRAHFAFSPNSVASWGYLASGLGALACLVLLVGGLRYARPARRGSPELSRRADAPSPWAASRAARAALLGFLALGFLFGVPVGPVLACVVGLVLWRGVATRALVTTAGLVLGLAVPVLYVARPGDSAGGNFSGYPAHHLAAHWLGSLAVTLLALACWRGIANVARDVSYSEAHG